MLRCKAKGTRYELRVVKALRAKGWLATRSAGSRGPFDVWAVSKDGRIKLIQVKATGKLSPSKRIQLEHLAKCFPWAEVEIWTWDALGKAKKERV